MRRITISIDEPLAQQFDDLIERHGYQNRSEAFRDLLRSRVESERKSTAQARFCVATVTYIYNHRERELASRLMALQHDHHDLTVSTMHVHLDHENCLETVVLRGKYKDVTGFADILTAQSGVRHGNIHVVPVELAMPLRSEHVHVQPHRHMHFAPKT